MNKKLIGKLAFSCALVAVMLAVSANVSMAQLKPKPDVSSTCPANACPTNLSGYTHIGSCENTFPHCVEECDVWQLNGANCYADCAWQ